MTKRTQVAYDAVFNFIDAKIFDLSGTYKFITDFEIAMRNSLRKQYPLSKLSSCQFHFAQAVHRRASKIKGLLEFLRRNDVAEKIYYKLMYIALLPATMIDSTFDFLMKKAEDEVKNYELNQLIKYFHRQWIIKEGATKISVFGNEIRTTSAAEGYNRALGAYCAKKGSFIWFCVSIRNQEFMKSAEFLSFADSGGLVGCHQKLEDKV